MQQSISRKIAVAIAILALFEIATQTAAVIILGKVFDFPDVLRKPASEVLQLFYANQRSIVPGYYLFLLSSLLYLPLTALLVRVGNRKASIWKQVLMLAGVATAIFQSIGFSRWIFSVPVLANQYMQPDTTLVMKQTIEMMYTTVNTYFGMTIGEHLGFITMAVWTISVAMLLPYYKLLKVFGIVVGLLLFISIGENFGGSYAPVFGQLNFVANSLWQVWLLAISIKFFSQERLIIKTTNSLKKVVTSSIS